MYFQVCSPISVDGPSKSLHLHGYCCDVTVMVIILPENGVCVHRSELKFWYCYTRFIIILLKYNSEECCGNLLILYVSDVAVLHWLRGETNSVVLNYCVLWYHQVISTELKKKKRLKWICGTFLWHPIRIGFSEMS